MNSIHDFPLLLRVESAPPEHGAAILVTVGDGFYRSASAIVPPARLLAPAMLSLELRQHGIEFRWRTCGRKNWGNHVLAAVIRAACCRASVPEAVTNGG